MDRALRPVRPLDDDGDVARHHHEIAVAVAGEVTIADADRAIEIGFDERLVGDLRRAADMEGAHRQLRARLADGLRRDDAHRLAHVDRRAARKVAAVACAADAVLGFAGQHRADFHFLDAGRIDVVDMPFLDHLAGGDDDVALKVLQILGRGTAENARRQRGDDLPRIDDRAHA